MTESDLDSNSEESDAGLVNPEAGAQLDWMPAWRLRELIIAGELSPVEVTRHFLDRIERLDPDLHCYVTVDREGALATARALEKSVRTPIALGPLFGVPVSIKDNYWTRGLRTTGGSLVHRDHVPEQDATCVARVRAAGGIIVGKTNTPEFALSWRSRNRLMAETVNPWDRRRTSGGSSGGAAASVAAGMTPIAVGSDCAGSIRLPAAFCGVVGLMPSNGRVSRFGAFGGSLQFTGVGPITRDIRDAAALLGVLSGYDHLDPTSLRESAQKYDLEPLIGATELRCAWWDVPGGGEGSDPRVVETAHMAARRIADVGATFEEPGLVLGSQEYTFAMDQMSFADRYQNHGQAILEDPDLRKLLTPVVAQRFELGKSVTGAEYSAALRQRFRLTDELAGHFEQYDILVSPTVGFVAPPMPEDWIFRPPGITDYTYLANFSGCTAVSVPCGFVDGLPVSLQLMGRQGAESTVLRLAHVLQVEFALANQHPPLH